MKNFDITCYIGAGENQELEESEYYAEWCELDEDVDFDTFESFCRMRDYGLDMEDLDEDSYADCNIF